MMLSCSGQSAVVVSGVTTYHSSWSAVWRASRGWLCIRLADWWSGGACPRVRERGKERQQG